MANSYIRLKIAKTMTYKGRVLVPEEEITVDAQEADKLVERKLATIVDEEIDDGENTTEDELEGMSVDELKEYAQEADIDLKGITKKADIIAAIRKAM